MCEDVSYVYIYVFVFLVCGRERTVRKRVKGHMEFREHVTEIEGKIKEKKTLSHYQSTLSN